MSIVNILMNALLQLQYLGLFICYTALPRRKKALVGIEIKTIDGAPYVFNLKLNAAGTYQGVYQYVQEFSPPVDSRFHGIHLQISG